MRRALAIAGATMIVSAACLNALLEPAESSCDPTSAALCDAAIAAVRATLPGPRITRIRIGGNRCIADAVRCGAQGELDWIADAQVDIGSGCWQAFEVSHEKASGKVIAVPGSGRPCS